jgi:DNA-binding response OmpR family regulator
VTKTRVLVIDDEAPIRMLCRVNLEAEGIEVLEAPDGGQGIELARSESPDAVILDVMMPGLDGWEVARTLLAEEATKGIPIVFLTARADARDRLRGLEVGGFAYVTKPFNPMELAQVVRRAIASPGDREAAARRGALEEIAGAG